MGENKIFLLYKLRKYYTLTSQCVYLVSKTFVWQQFSTQCADAILLATYRYSASQQVCLIFFVIGNIFCE
jgi:hypothetical protein